MLICWFVFTFLLASVLANQKDATEADVRNKVASTLKYAPDKLGAGGRGKEDDEPTKEN